MRIEHYTQGLPDDLPEWTRNGHPQHGSVSWVLVGSVCSVAFEGKRVTDYDYFAQKHLYAQLGLSTITSVPSGYRLVEQDADLFQAQYEPPRRAGDLPFRYRYKGTPRD